MKYLSKEEFVTKALEFIGENQSSFIGIDENGEFNSYQEDYYWFSIILVNESLVLTYSDLTVRITSVNKIWSLSNKWYLLFFLLNVFPNLYKTY